MRIPRVSVSHGTILIVFHLKGERINPVVGADLLCLGGPDPAMVYLTHGLSPAG
jgi:hypothetical protein